MWMPLGLAYLAGSLRAAGFDPVIYDAMSLFHDLDQIRRRHRRDAARTSSPSPPTPPTVKAALDVLRAAKEESPARRHRDRRRAPHLHGREVLADPARRLRGARRGRAHAARAARLPDAGEEPAAVRRRLLPRRQAAIVGHTPTGRFSATSTRSRSPGTSSTGPSTTTAPSPGRGWPSSAGRGVAPRRALLLPAEVLAPHLAAARASRASSPKLRLLRDRYGVDTVEVADEYPTRDRERWERILDRLIEEDLGIELLMETRADDVVRDADLSDKYRDAGILHVYVGVESVRQDRLDSMRKNLAVDQTRAGAIELLNDTGIITETSFLLGFPGRDAREPSRRRSSSRLEYDPDLAFFLAMTPWPYADWYPQVADSVEVIDYSRYNLINPIIRPDDMTPRRARRSAVVRVHALLRRQDARAWTPRPAQAHVPHARRAAAHGGVLPRRGRPGRCRHTRGASGGAAAGATMPTAGVSTRPPAHAA